MAQAVFDRRDSPFADGSRKWGAGRKFFQLEALGKALGAFA
jgi:hypothetical protein